MHEQPLRDSTIIIWSTVLDHIWPRFHNTFTTQTETDQLR